MSFTIVRNDITEFCVDAIVNPTNTNLQKSGGTCSAIFKKAGMQELQSVCNKIAPINVCDAVITSGFNLPAKYIIHIAAPAYLDGKQGEEQLLRTAYINSLKCAVENKCKSIAFPLISSGIYYGYPKDDAIDIAIETIGEWLQHNDLDVSLVFSENDAFTGNPKIFNKYDINFDKNFDDENSVIDTLWIIGNGFDMASKLETSYWHFLNWYLKQSTENENIKNFKEKINSNISSWANLELKIGEVT